MRQDVELSDGTVVHTLDAFPFDSSPNLVTTVQGYRRGDRAVDAWTMQRAFAQFFSDGVFGTPADAWQIAKAGSGLAVTIQPGMAIIRGSMGGIKETDGPQTLTLDTVAAAGNICYGIMLRYDNNSDVRSLGIRVVKGVAGSSPQPPEPDTTSEGVHELRLGYVTVPNGATDLSNATITNEKGLDVCPYAAPFEEVDLSQVVADAKAQAQETTDAFTVYAKTYYDLVASALDGTTAGELQEEINNISPANFVDNITLSQTADGKMQVKTSGIGTGQLANSGVTTEKIVDGSVTSGKLAQSVFTDDPDSTAAASQKVAATPKMVHDLMQDQRDIADKYTYYSGEMVAQNYGYFNFQANVLTNSGFILSANSAQVSDDVSVVVSIVVDMRNESSVGLQVYVNDDVVYAAGADDGSGDANQHYGIFGYTVGLKLKANDAIKIRRLSSQSGYNILVRMESM